jgi:LacI family transcriptional regulator
LIRDGNFRRESGYQAAKELLTGPNPPTAIFSCNFMMNQGVVQAVEELGLESPRDIALATFDRLKLAEAFRPHMTAVEQPSYEIGVQGTRLLIQRIQNPSEDAPRVHIQLPTQLRIAESSSSRLSAAGV